MSESVYLCKIWWEVEEEGPVWTTKVDRVGVEDGTCHLPVTLTIRRVDVREFDDKERESSPLPRRNVSRRKCRVDVRVGLFVPKR